MWLVEKYLFFLFYFIHFPCGSRKKNNDHTCFVYFSAFVCIAVKGKSDRTLLLFLIDLFAMCRSILVVSNYIGFNFKVLVSK